MDSLFIDIFENGTYYNPAWKHYGSNGMTVTCDRCKSSGLKICIGYESSDLCMACIMDISQELSSKSLIDRLKNPFKKPIVKKIRDCDTAIVTKMSQDIYRNNTQTLMRQHLYTQMEQNMYTYMLQKMYATRMRQQMYE